MKRENPWVAAFYLKIRLFFLTKRQDFPFNLIKKVRQLIIPTNSSLGPQKGLSIFNERKSFQAAQN